jgi:hypothetical protein
VVGRTAIEGGIHLIEMAAQLLNRGATRVENPDGLGGRDLDRAYNWASHVKPFQSFLMAFGGP